MAAKSIKNQQKTAIAPEKMREKAALAALEQAGLTGWDSVTLTGVAENLGITLADFSQQIEDASDLLNAIGRLIDRRTLDNIRPSPDETPRDRLFEIIMERFEVMNEHRDGLTSLMRSLRFNPLLALGHLSSLARSMVWMLEAAGIAVNGPSSTIKIIGLTGIFLKTLKIWADDDSADLSKTMAALDRDLARAEKSADFLKF